MQTVGCVRCFSALIKGGVTAAEAKALYNHVSDGKILIYGGKSYCLGHYVEKANGEKPWKTPPTLEKLGVEEDTGAPE